jgi:hypothetical protein
MSGLSNTRKRMFNVGRGKGYKSGAERQAAAEASIQTAKDDMFASAIVPDEEQIKRNSRRKAAKRRGSRVNTVLTDRDTLGYRDTLG